MPLYEYQCDACGRQFELIRKFSDPPLQKCPTCGGTVQKLMSSPAIQFKGSGWYITDYARKGQGGASQSDEAKADAAAKDRDKGEKPADKTEKSEKAETTTKSEKSEKAEKTESKADKKGGSRGDAAPASSSPASKKD